MQLVDETHIGRISIVGFLTAATTGLVYGWMFGTPRGGGIIVGFLLSMLYAIILWAPCVLIWRKYFLRLKNRIGIAYSATILTTIFGFISPLPFWLGTGLVSAEGNAIQLNAVYQVFALSLFALIFGIIPAVIGGILGYIFFRNTNVGVAE